MPMMSAFTSAITRAVNRVLASLVVSTASSAEPIQSWLPLAVISTLACHPGVGGRSRRVERPSLNQPPELESLALTGRGV
jgi:hypothetical protein